MQLEHMGKYEAEIQLGTFESLAGNDVIKSKLIAAGFSDVIVAGQGRVRIAQGVWKGFSRDVNLPSQVKKVKKL